MTQLTSIVTDCPEHRVSPAETKEFLGMSLSAAAAAKFCDRVDALQIRSRHILAPLQVLGCMTTVEERESRYQREAVTLGERVARRALTAAALDPQVIDVLILASSTGHMIPTLDLHLRHRIGLRADVRSFALNGLGCTGALRAMGLAADLLAGSPPQRAALVISVELCSLWLQVSEPSPEDVLSNISFGDGAAAAIVQNDPGARSVEIVASRTVLWPHSLDARGARLTSTGLRHFSAPTLPRAVRTHVRETVRGFLADNGVAASDLSCHMINPSDQRLLRAASTMLDVRQRDVDAAFGVWEAHGNTLAVSPLRVMQAVQAAARPRDGELGLVVVFGPGVTCEMLLLKWRGAITGESLHA